MRKVSKKIPLYRLKVSPQAIKEVNSSLKSGWLSPGPKVASFEKAICKLMHSRYGALVSSATDGIELALTALGAMPLKEVITTPFTFVATVHAIMATGATPVFADIDAHTLNIDPEEVERKITERTVAIIPVDIGGYPADYDALNKICDDKKLLLIADAAHSIATLYRGKPVTHYSNVAVISFHATKNLFCGEGGVVLADNKSFIEAIKIMSQHGITSSAYQRKTAHKWKYDATHPGFKTNMSELHAAIGLGQLAVFKKEQEKRSKLGKRYLKNLAGLSKYLELPIVDKPSKHGWHLFIIKLHLSALKIKRNRFIELMADYGIECGVHFQPIFDLSYYHRNLQLNPQHFPNTVYAGKRVVTLPLYPLLSYADVDYISECISKIVKKYAR
ncbi:MAG: DegT/DnrJ/EryC1/StrS family aminotransferase [FCB group bacterium]|nr:DegT/DnrJ/EryC1/StrS family aminotransferase [FCB group bacterium]